MKNKTINSLQFGTLFSFTILSTLIGIGFNNVTRIAKVDSYISILLAYIIGFIPILLFIYLFNQEKTITELTKETFGKTLGTIINYLLLIPILTIGICSVYSISNFMVSQFLSDTPIIIIYVIPSLVILYGLIKGIETISRTSLILYVIMILLFFTAIFGLAPQIEISNYKPILEHGLTNPLKGSIIFVLSDIIPLFVMLSISKKNIINKEKTTKSIIIFYSISILIMFLNIAMTIGTLGIHLTDMYQYPEYMVLKQITLFDFLDRIENFVTIQWVFRTFMLVSMIVYYIQNTIKKDDNSKLLPSIILTTIIIIDIIIFKNNTIFTNFALKIYPYTNLFLFILITIISIGVFIKKQRRTNNN